MVTSVIVDVVRSVTGCGQKRDSERCSFRRWINPGFVWNQEQMAIQVFVQKPEPWALHLKYWTWIEPWTLHLKYWNSIEPWTLHLKEVEIDCPWFRFNSKGERSNPETKNLKP